MVNRIYTPADRRLPAELLKIQKSLADAQVPTGTERDRTMMKMQEQVDKLAAQQQILDAQQALITDAAKVYSDSSGESHTAASWMPNPPSVTASSLSKKFRITVTGGSTGGSTILTFSAPGYDRDRALGASAAAVLARAIALGGMSDPGTAQRSWIVTMPSTNPYTFTAQARPTDQYATAVGLQIDVQPIL